MEISKKEFIRLSIADATLNRLEAGGVDNWEWYGESLNPNGEPSFDEMEEEIRKKINNLEVDQQ